MRTIKYLRDFSKAKAGNVAVVFGLCLIPLVFIVGSAADYSSAVLARSELQNAVDAAVLTGIMQDPTTRNTVATNAFGAAMPNSSTSYSTSFSTASDGSFSGSATANVATTFMKVANINSLTVGAGATAVMAPAGPPFCMVTEANGESTSTSAFTLNGAPTMNLVNCALFSNASMTCNGHSGEASASIAVGTISGCQDPESSSSSFNDVFKTISSNITLKCGSFNGGVSWTPGSIPAPSSNFIPVLQSGYTEYHVCGTLTLSGSGSLMATGESAAIVVENGDVDISAGANIQSSLTTLVLTGSNSSSHVISFPNGKGQAAALTLSPPTNASNPWHGMAIYIDPALTSNVDDSFGAGASLTFDGVAYMPNTNLTMKGNSSSGAGACSELVTNSFTSDGSASINFEQSSAACSALDIPEDAVPYLKT